MDSMAFRKISYGLYIVSANDGTKRNGQIANTVFQTSADPPMMAICLNKQNLTHALVQASKVAAISVLSVDTPMEFIGRFGFKSGRDLDKFEGVNQRSGVTGAPVVLDHTVAYFELRIRASVDSETHTLFLGEVAAAEVLDAQAEPMTYAYYHQVKGGTSPKTAPTYIAPEPAAKPKPKAAPKGGAPETGKWVCTVCGYIYDPTLGDPDGGIAPGTAFEDIPEDWVCPVCGAAKDKFEPV